MSQLKLSNSPSKLKKLALWWVFMPCLIGIILSFPIRLHAKVSEEYLTHLVQKISADCANQNIVIRNDCTDINKKSTIPSNLDQTKELRLYVAQLNNLTYEMAAGGVVLGGGRSCKGRSLIQCGSHVLDINGSDYIWDGVVFTIPPTNINNTAINNSGNLIQGSTGANIQGGNRISGKNNRITEKAKIDVTNNQNVNVAVYLQQIKLLNNQVMQLSKKAKLLEILIAILSSVFSACLIFLLITPRASTKKRILHAVLMLISCLALGWFIIL